jgi:predicted GIY-YIG superfamily endonuclease
MFSALDYSDDKNIEKSVKTHTKNKKSENTELLNSTHMSFGKEIEQMHKQLQEEMQLKINDLENKLKQKD